MEYNHSIDYSKYDIGKDWYYNNEICIFDPIRKILVLKTPEEVVRQKFIQYLIHELKVPETMIEVEVPMSHFKEGAKGRADIIVYKQDEDSNYTVTLVIECKSVDVPLIDRVWDQVIRYDQIVEADLIIITNGVNTYIAAWIVEDEEYQNVEKIPTYKELAKGEKDFEFIQQTEEWERPKVEQFTKPETLEQFRGFGWIGDDTKENLYPLIFNLGGLLQDTTLRSPHLKTTEWKIVDQGHRFTSSGNAAGGSWPADYKYFIIEDDTNNNQIISLAILGMAKTVNDPRFGTRRGGSTIIVAVDNFDKSHNSLQLNIDKYTDVKGSHFTIWHDGKMTVGKKGSLKTKEVRNYMKDRKPSLLDEEGRILLGTLDCSKELHWEQEQVKRFIENIITYALLRDELREIKNPKN